MSVLGVASVISGIAESAYNIYNAQRNYKNMVEQQKYSKDLQQTMFQREDNAVQRRVADLKKAGLSPVLAAGSAASAGAPISVNPPKGENISLSAPLDKASMYLAMVRQKADISRTIAENELIQLQKQKVTADTLDTLVSVDKNSYNLELAKKMGMPSDVGGLAKQVGSFANSISSSVSHFKDLASQKMSEYKYKQLHMPRKINFNTKVR